jgi:hypothetical protein
VLYYAVPVGPNEFATVSHDALNDTATVSLYKTVTDAFSLHSVRKYEPNCDSDVCIAWWTADVIAGNFYNYCFGDLQVVAEQGAESHRFINWLGKSYPNPMNPTARIDFSLKESGRVTLRVFDVSGRLVTTLVDRVMEAGKHNVVWDGRDGRGRDMASAVYFYRIETDSWKSSRKLLILR